MEKPGYALGRRKLMIRVRLPLWLSETILRLFPNLPWPVRRWLYITRIRKPSGAALAWALATAAEIEREKAKAPQA